MHCAGDLRDRERALRTIAKGKFQGTIKAQTPTACCVANICPRGAPFSCENGVGTKKPPPAEDGLNASAA
jgi:hypothetical protein